MAVLVGDIGGTHARLAVAVDGRLVADTLKRFENRQFYRFEQVVETYLEQFDASVLAGLNRSVNRGNGTGRGALVSACFAIAGPVNHGQGKLTNHDWHIDGSVLGALLGIDDVLIINDLAALGYGIGQPGMAGNGIAPLFGVESDKSSPEDPDHPNPLSHGHRGEDSSQRQSLVVNLGTGFNIAPVCQTGGRCRAVFSSEAGHSHLPHTVMQRLRSLMDEPLWLAFVTVEDLFSGHGLVRFFAAISGGRELTARQIFAAAQEGDEVCQSVLPVYANLLGTFCHDLVLSHLPHHGFYFAGSIAKALFEVGYVDDFRAGFKANVRNDLAIHVPPFHIIRSDGVALQGCVEAANQHFG